MTYSTNVVEYNTIMALVVLMVRCNFVSAGTETEATGHDFIDKLSQGSPLIYNWRFEANRSSVYRNLSGKYIIGLTIHQEVQKL